MKNLANEKPNDELHGRTKWIVENINKNDIKNKIVLNIGCGFGWFEYNFQNEVKELFSIEPTEESLSTVKNNIHLMGNTVHFMIGSAIDLPFEDNFFDTVVSWDVIEHIPVKTENKMLEEISRVLKPEGVASISTPYKHLINNLMDPAWFLIGHRHYSKNDMLNLADGTNLKVEEIFVKGGKWSIINTLNLYLAKWLFHRKPFFSRQINSLEDNEWKKGKGVYTLFVKFRKIQKQ